MRNYKKILLVLFTFFVGMNFTFADDLDCSKSLKMGSTGNEVKALQEKLNKYMNCSLNVDGIFGNKTYACTTRFQEKYDLEKDGIVGKKTCRKLNSNLEIIKEDDLDCSKTLKIGSTGDEVKTLQEKLNKYMDCSLDTDGTLGNKTYACIVKFQEKYDLTQDGIVGNKTCSKLNSNLKIIKEDKLDITDGNNVVITSDEVNIRKGIYSKTKVIKTAKRGDIYTYEKVVSMNGSSWYKVKIDDDYGYVNKEDVSKRFILVDISEQRLVYFNNKRVKLNTKVITGMKNKHDTPLGHYVLNVSNKEINRTLRGNNDDGSTYASHVDYWMPFITDRGIGFHDADWRSESAFDDNTYIYNGSHGCVNMMHKDAEFLYNKLTNNTDVIVRA